MKKEGEKTSFSVFLSLWKLESILRDTEWHKKKEIKIKRELLLIVFIAVGKKNRFEEKVLCKTFKN